MKHLIVIAAAMLLLTKGYGEPVNYQPNYDIDFSNNFYWENDDE